MADKNTTTIRIQTPTPMEAAMLRALTPAEKKVVLIEAAKKKLTKAVSKQPAAPAQE